MIYSCIKYLMLVSPYNSYHDMQNLVQILFILYKYSKMQSCNSLVNYTYNNNFKSILRIKCLVCVCHDNHKLYHIMIMNLCDMIITLSILMGDSCLINYREVMIVTCYHFIKVKSIMFICNLEAIFIASIFLPGSWSALGFQLPHFHPPSTGVNALYQCFTKWIGSYRWSRHTNHHVFVRTILEYLCSRITDSSLLHYDINTTTT